MHANKILIFKAFKQLWYFKLNKKQNKIEPTKAEWVSDVVMVLN